MKKYQSNKERNGDCHPFSILYFSFVWYSVFWTER